MKILFIILFLLCGCAEAQTKKLRWTTETCEFEGNYKASRYSKTKLINTLKLLEIGSFKIQTDATPRTFEGIKSLNIAELDREYEQKSSELKRLDIVKSPYWETIRQKKLTELEQVYRLSRTTMRAYEQPAALKEFRFADACVKRYANALINGDTELLGIWRTVNEQSRRNNADPARIKDIFDRQLNSPDKLNYARIEVMTFGWWNCANEFIQYEQGYDRHVREFKKLFTRVKTIGCDEQ